MTTRACLPGEMFLDAILIDARRLDTQSNRHQGEGDWVLPKPLDQETRARVLERGPYIALHWVLNPALGIPLEPFTVWRRPVSLRENATPIIGRHLIGYDTFGWDGFTEMLRIEIDVSAATTAWGLSRADNDPVTFSSGAAGTTIVLEGGPMVGVRVTNQAAVTAVRGLSTVTMANGSGWKAIEIVGLPFSEHLAGTTYYGNVKQGPVAALTDPVSAAVQRLKNWGPVLGWGPLAGLPPWRAPDAVQLVKEVQGDVLTGLVDVLKQAPPPHVGQQYLKEVVLKLAGLRQVIGTKFTNLNGPGDNQRSEIRTRPLQGLATSVACDVWASLALGFGTGAPRGAGVDDFMVTAPWMGLFSMQVPSPWPWPWASPPEPVLLTEQVSRELAAVVLAPKFRTPPAAPAPIAPTISFAEGAPGLDQPYRCASAIRTTRPPALPNAARVSSYGLARFDGAGIGRYSMREHPLAQGWIPVGSAVAVRQPEQLPDPELMPDTVMLRDSGIEMPIKGAARLYQYAVAASDLFGQWSAWSPAWLSVDPAQVRSPAVSVLHVRARPGPGNTDPCKLAVNAEIIWDRRERSCSQMHVVVDVFSPVPAPPAQLADPPSAPQTAATQADVIVSFDSAGYPKSSLLPVGVEVIGLHDDETPVTPAHPATSEMRRYRITFSSVPITYAGAKEKAVALYVRGEETVRPGEWSGWAQTREVAIAPNPLPPIAPQPLPPNYPLWASLPNAAGLSYASVTWMPTGAWRYRVYEATEAALLAACGQPGPVLTTGLGERMQALFDLYKNSANWDKLKAAYRKLGDEPVSPPVQSGGKMRFESLLPRGSSLIHCYIVAGVTETNVISSWPQADNDDGRKGFLAYAIPRPLRPALPEVLVRTGAAGVAEVTVRVGGAVPATAIRLYRAPNALLARQVGTMQLISTVTTDPAAWQQTVITDATAPRSWSRVQYRAVAVTDDDPDRAGMAIPSLPSKAYALLNPPPNPPTVSLAPNVSGTNATAALVRVDTNAPRNTTDIGDHTLAWVVTKAGGTPIRSSSRLAGITVFPTVAALMASTQPVAYIGTGSSLMLYMRLDRASGQALGLTVDLTDPLGRQTHVVIDIPPWLPDPAPLISNFIVGRSGGVVTLSLATNVPLPPDPARDWTFRVEFRDAATPMGPTTVTTFALSSLKALHQASEMPNPALVPDMSAIRRLAGRILMWVRAPVAQRVRVRLTNSANIWTSDEKVTP